MLSFPFMWLWLNEVASCLNEGPAQFSVRVKMATYPICKAISDSIETWPQRTTANIHGLPLLLGVEIKDIRVYAHLPARVIVLMELNWQKLIKSLIIINQYV